MARKRPLVELLDKFRATCRLSLNPAHGAQTRDLDVKLLQNTQELLYDDYNWPHLSVERQMPAQAGQRFYGPPADVSIDAIDHIEFRYGTEWRTLLYGIGPEQYSTWDSDLDVQSWPVVRWKIWEDEQIELWPIPANDQDPTSKDGTLKVIGYRNLAPLVADSDLCDLDDWLIVYTAAAERLAMDDKKGAVTIRKKAERRYFDLKAQLQKQGSFGLFQGSSTSGRRLLRGPARVQYVQKP